MADENKGLDVTPEPTDTTVSPETTPEPAPGGAVLGLDAEVDVDGQTVKVRDLVAARDRMIALENYKTHAGNLMRGDEFGPDKEVSLRHVMREDGWGEQEIDEHISTMREAMSDETFPTSSPEQGQGITDTPGAPFSDGGSDSAVGAAARCAEPADAGYGASGRGAGR